MIARAELQCVILNLVQLTKMKLYSRILRSNYDGVKTRQLRLILSPRVLKPSENKGYILKETKDGVMEWSWWESFSELGKWSFSSDDDLIILNVYTNDKKIGVEPSIYLLGQIQ